MWLCRADVTCMWRVTHTTMRHVSWKPAMYLSRTHIKLEMHAARADDHARGTSPNHNGRRSWVLSYNHIVNGFMDTIGLTLCSGAQVFFQAHGV